MTTNHTAEKARDCRCGHPLEAHDDSGRCCGEHPLYGSRNCPQPECPCGEAEPLPAISTTVPRSSIDPWQVGRELDRAYDDRPF